MKNITIYVLGKNPYSFKKSEEEIKEILRAYNNNQKYEIKDGTTTININMKYVISIEITSILPGDPYNDDKGLFVV